MIEATEEKQLTNLQINGMRPIGDHVLVTPIAEDDEILAPGGTRFVLADTAKDKPNRGKVVSVGEDSPAAKAGLLADDCVVAFNGQPLRNGIDYYVHLLAQKPNSEVRLTVRRAEKTLDVTVPLEAMPLPDGRKLAEKLLGVQLEEVSDKLRREYELPANVGLVVSGVTRGGPADKAGIVPTDLIMRLDRVPVAALKDVGLTLEQAHAGDQVVVEGLRVDTNRPFFWSVTLRAKGGR